MAVQNNTDRTPDTAQRLPPPAVEEVGGADREFIGIEHGYDPVVRVGTVVVIFSAEIQAVSGIGRHEDAAGLAGPEVLFGEQGAAPALLYSRTDSGVK